MSNIDFRLVEILSKQNTVGNALDKTKKVDTRKL